jgi:uncharacterized protein (DUF1499 family)
MSILKWVLLTPLALALLLLVAGQLGALQGRPPQRLGVHEGRLRPPSNTPNSVHSQASAWPDHPQREYAQIAPLPGVGADSAHAAASVQRVREVALRLPGAQVIEAQGDYLRMAFTTRWLRFVDDAEFWFEPAAGVVHVRSASRLGRKDFGVNRARVEALRAALAAG